MPLIRADTLAALAAAFTSPQDIVVPFHKGQRGNPVGWGAAHWPSLMTLSGDRGAASLLPGLNPHIRRVDVDDPGVLRDFDTPEALASLNQGE